MNEHWTEFQVSRGMEDLAPFYPSIPGRAFVAGSFAAWMIGREGVKPNDIDIFATTNDNALSLSEVIRAALGGSDFQDNGLTFSRPADHYCRWPLQIVRPNPAWSKWPDDLLDSFDLDVCRAVLVSPKTIIADLNAGMAEAKVLRINNPLREMRRVIKYAGRGTRFNDWELLKLFRAWEQVSETDRNLMIETAQREAFPESFVDDEQYEDRDPDYWYDDDDYFEGE